MDVHISCSEITLVCLHGYQIHNNNYYYFKHYFIAVSELIKNPPDNSTLWGRPIRYTYAMDVVFPDTGPCVLVVDGLSTNFSGVNQALKVYLRNITEVKPLSCVVSGRQAIVKFQDDQGDRFLLSLLIQYLITSCIFLFL